MKINKLLGDSYHQLPNQKTYPYYFNYNDFGVDTSTVYPGDTVTVFQHGEMIMHRDPIAFKKGSECFKSISNHLVTVEEYRDFQNHVIDSIARLKLFLGLEDDDDANEFLHYKSPYYDKYEGKWMDFAPGHREVNLGQFQLSYRKKIDFENPQHVPLFADMYIPPYERFQRKRIIDERKLTYRYDVHLELLDDLTYEETFKRFPHLCDWYQMKYQLEEIPTIVDHYQWAKLSKHPFDERAVFSQLYQKSFEEIPLIGINGMQALAFCHWKEDEIQASLNDAGINLIVKVTLPTSEDQLAKPLNDERLNIPANDYTGQWRIEEDEYNEFVADVRDSILREYLYQQMEDDKEALKMLQYLDLYFGESRLEYVEISRYNRELNRQLFTFDPRYKIKRNRPEIKSLIQEFESKNLPSAYRFQWMDAQGRSILGEFSLSKWQERVRSYYELTSKDSLGNPIGKEYIFYGNDGPCTSNGVRSHENLKRFNVDEVTLVDVVSKNEQVPFMQRLSYDQAIAFYHWKYPIFRATEKDDWRNYVYPAKEEFAKIQKGETIIVPEQKWEYPSAKFRYVVHLYKPT